MDVGHSEDWFALQVAVAPCFIGYDVIAQRLYKDSKTARGHQNKYWKWIETYVSDDYVETVSQVKGGFGTERTSQWTSLMHHRCA